MKPLTSDHVPVCLNTHNIWNDGSTPFKYFGEWMEHSECKPIIILDCYNTNAQECHAFTFVNKLRNVKHTLKPWNKSAFENIRTNIKEHQI